MYHDFGTHDEKPKTASSCVARALILTLIVSLLAVAFVIYAQQAMSPLSASTISAGSWSPAVPDPRVLRWNSYTEGQTASGRRYRDAFGSLTVPLVHDDPASPQLNLQVILRRFEASATPSAEQSTAPLGVLLGHCGGPGSDAMCGIGMTTSVVESPPKPLEFDLLGISQRGVAPNVPGMSCPSMTGVPPILPLHPKKLPPSLAELSSGCECAFVDGAKAGYMFKDIDTADEAAVRSVFASTRAMSDRCYQSAYWTMMGLNGTVYNFLDYVGTAVLARDLDSLRAAMGIDRISVYGASYGTMVGATYASTFPERVDRLILDGNMYPFSNALPLGMEWPNTVSQVIEAMLENCRVNAKCALQDPFGAYYAVLDACRAGQFRSPPTADGTSILLTNGLVVGYLHAMAALRACGWKQALLTLALLRGSPRQQEAGVVRVLNRMCTVSGNATWQRYSACIDEVMVGKDTDPIMGTAVLALDFANRLSVEGGVELWRTARSLYGAAPLGHMLGYMASITTWRATPTPVAPFGTASVAPLVLGNLYDQATSYILTQRMAAAFPQSSLLTYQGTGHCLEFPSPGRPSNMDPVGTTQCDRMVIEYLRSGRLPRTGHTCRNHHGIPVPTAAEVAATVPVS